ncbi:MAG TPA: error-prone DNA polymerase, partial [Acidimicrobiaceae bacterium]|nr:error-prone DNA polymerase [Acidimicrobiaceae bacterium]
MGFTNPQWTWNELEARLSGRASQGGRDGRAPGSPAWNAGGDAPAWSRQRQPFEAPVDHAAPRGIRVPYAELHARSHFSFLEGASHPEALAVEASRLGLDALGLCDRDGLYGVIRFAEAARSLRLPTVIGTELTLPKDADDEHGKRIVVLADGPSGYSGLSRALSLGLLAGSKGAPRHNLDAVAEHV